MEQKTMMYNSMYSYVADADISHYRYPCSIQEAPDLLIEAFRPVEDPDLYVDWESERVENGKTYVQIWWGESTDSFVLIDATEDFCYIRYERFYQSPNDEFGEYISDGKVYETEEDAKGGKHHDK